MPIPAIIIAAAPALAKKLFQLFVDHQAGKITKDQLEAEVSKASIQSMTDIAKVQGEVVMAEINGESWLQRNWRPILALTSFFSYWFVIIAYPFAVRWGLLPQVAFGEKGLENLFYLTVTCVGGYIASRSVEKIVRG